MKKILLLFNLLFAVFLLGCKNENLFYEVIDDNISIDGNNIEVEVCSEYTKISLNSDNSFFNVIYKLENTALVENLYLKIIAQDDLYYSINSYAVVDSKIENLQNHCSSETENISSFADGANISIENTCNRIQFYCKNNMSKKIDFYLIAMQVS